MSRGAKGRQGGGKKWREMEAGRKQINARRRRNVEARGKARQESLKLRGPEYLVALGSLVRSSEGVYRIQIQQRDPQMRRVGK